MPVNLQKKEGMIMIQNKKRFVIAIVSLVAMLMILVVVIVKLIHYDNNVIDTKENEDTINDEKILTWIMPKFAFQNINKDIYENAANDLLSSKNIDFTLKFIVLDNLNNYNQALTDYINSGRRVDLFYSGDMINRGFPDGITNSHMLAYQNNLILPFENFIDTEDGQAIYKIFNDTYWNSLRINGKINGILAMGNGISATGGIFIKRGFADSSISQINTGYDLDIWKPALLKMKNNGYIYPLSLCDDFASCIEFLGYTFIDAAIAVDSDRDAFNVFEDADFINYLRQANELADEGFIDPDINAPFEEKSFQVLGKSFNNITEHEGYDLYQTASPVVQSMSSAVCISSTSLYPDEAVKLLAMAVTDQEFADALVYGKEGVDFERAEGRVVAKPGHSLSFLLPWYTGLYYFCSPSFNDSLDKKQIYMEHINKAATTPLTGFTFYSKGWEDKILKINEIVKNALLIHIVTGNSERGQSTGLLIGLNPDWEATVGKIVSDLKNAGIDELINEVNRQLTNWKSKYK